MRRAEEVLGFWIDEVGQDRWYETDTALDARISAEFGETVDAARRGRLDGWMLTPRGALALIVLLDQFPRNIWRGAADAFASDEKALAVAKRSIRLGHDLKTPEPERQFFYLPMMHAETNADQDRCVRLMLVRMPQTGARNLPHAVAHREVIRRFGRFPYRNAALGRKTTSAEAAWLDESGYRA